MANSNGYMLKDKPVFDVNSRRSWESRRQLLVYLAAGFWLLVSLYPTYLYWVDNSSLRARPKTNRMVITETIAVPAVKDDPVPGRAAARSLNSARLTDTLNSFKHFQQTENCTVDSLDLHVPFEPLCSTKDGLLEAIGGGGRIGHDAPYIPRSCDMRWFSVSEICQVLERFEKVFIIGDTGMRQVAMAAHIFLRADLTQGTRAPWASELAGEDCSCRAPFDTHKCAANTIANTADLLEHDPESIYCDAEGFGGFEYHPLLEYPLKDVDMKLLTDSLQSSRPKRPYAFVMGHGLWNDLDKEKTYAWIDQVVDGVAEAAPYLVKGRGHFYPRLFLTPSAAGRNKPDIFVARQGNIALANFEKAVGPFVKHRGMDHLGTYNMSIQASNPDGTHGGMETNLIKAMMVFNWLNALQVPDDYDTSKARSGH